MPQIIVKANRGEGAVMLRERVTVTDFESEHFAAQLVERLGWAVGDAHEVERDHEVEDDHQVEREAPELAPSRA